MKKEEPDKDKSKERFAESFNTPYNYERLEHSYVEEKE